MNSTTNLSRSGARPDGSTLQSPGFRAVQTSRPEHAARPATTARFLARWAAALIVLASTAQAQEDMTPKKPAIGSTCSLLVIGEHGAKHSAARRNAAEDRTRSRVKGTLMLFDERWVMVETKGGWQVWIPRSAVVSLRTRGASE